MQLYKSRGFSAFFQDTFSFIKQNGKHYFKHFFIINGFFLLILIVIGYFISKFYSEFLFSGVLQGGSNNTVVDDFMNENFGVFIILVVVFIVFGLIAGLISYSYTAIYLKLYSENDGKNFDTQQIIQVYKQNIGNLFVFLICSILLGIPLMVILGIGVFALMITIVGSLLIPVLLGAFMLFYNMTLMEYLQLKRGIWDSFGYAWILMTKKFWAAVGSVGIFYLIAYVAQNVITLIPYLFFMGSMFTTIPEGNTSPEEIGASFMVLMLVVFFITFIVGTILNNITQLNQGIVYYSLKEENENINTKSVIDQIGSGE
jgi:MFS family permease